MRSEESDQRSQGNFSVHLKRVFDLVCASAGIIALAPAMLVIACWIRMDSSGSAIFRQERVGLNGRIFQIIKFRTMHIQQDPRARQITVGPDPRITRAGFFLRKYKLDELPQLFNVLAGDMSLVGPRPEVPRYVALYPEEVRKRVLSVLPGVTDLASIEYRHESDILGRSDNPERTYVEKIMPEKLKYAERYVAERSFSIDIKIIIRTLIALTK